MEINRLVEVAHEYAKGQGFWPDRRSLGEVVALIHSEASELLEAFRKGDETNAAEEMADILIRVCDLAGHLKVDLNAAVLNKMKINRLRPYKHGVKF